MATLRHAFPGGHFSDPASEREIAAAETALNITLPGVLRSFYLETNGFREPKGYAQYLSTLDEVISGTQFMWETLPASNPDVRFPDMKPFVFFGQDGIGGWWGMRLAPPHDIIYWHHHLLDDGPIYRPQAGDVIDVMKAALALYDEAENDLS